MRRRIKALLVGCLLLVGFAAVFCFWLLWRQGIRPSYWQAMAVAGEEVRVVFDEQQIPTIDAPNWERLVETQGFVVAADRLWQMDLIRRKAGGRLAEWFGAKAFDHDRSMQLEDHIEVAKRAAAQLPVDEKRYCEAYARGVNRFITEFPNRWGIEYLLLRQVPEAWTCADSLLVVLEMAHVLSKSTDVEAKQFAWKSQLSQGWQDFLFPRDHPWNKPFFGEVRPLALPSDGESLPKRPITAEEQKQQASLQVTDPFLIGSNSWAWNGKTGHYLSNDPHLGYGVPSIWYAMRLRVSEDDWVVGAAIPGLPGIVIGMNPMLAWSFTNTGEDVDDYLEEKLSPDGKNYLAGMDGEREVWQPILRKNFAIKVAGEERPRQVEGMFTHRGPLAQRSFLGKSYYSRQWLPLKEGMLRVPAVQMAQAHTIEALNKTLQSIKSPAQNALYMNHDGSMGYRVVGTGVVRKQSGLIPRPALEGEWLGFEPAEQRRHLELKKQAGHAQHLATANERIWVDEFGHHWSSDDRFERIDRYLATREDFTRQDMEALQMDTQGRFRQMLLRWIAKHATPSAAAAETLRVWQSWDGSSRQDERTFTQSSLVEEALVKLLVGRVQRAFIRQATADTEATLASETTGGDVRSSDAGAVPYTSELRRAWMVALLEAPPGKGMAVFGLDDSEVADYLLDRILPQGAKPPSLHSQVNRWRGQHPFVDGARVLGRAFKIREIPQWGAFDLVLAEQNKFGPSMRLVWDMSRPWESTWAFPVGQSGHILSRHYRDWHALWAADQRLAVFPSPSGWRFAGQAAPFSQSKP